MKKSEREYAEIDLASIVSASGNIRDTAHAASARANVVIAAWPACSVIRRVSLSKFFEVPNYITVEDVWIHVTSA